jgi:mannose-1-phosphate guanylyltransferase / phosphomannomutase
MAVEQAVILCGGLGTRMGDLVKEVPKPMLPVAGRPVLEHTVQLLKAQGIKSILFAAGYKGEVIQDHFGDGEAFGMNIETVIEDKQMGTSGALTLLAGKLQDNFLVLYGDEFIDLDLTPMLQLHHEKQPLATILTRPSTHPWDAHLVQTDETGRITEFIRKRQEGRLYKNLGNGAIYVLSKVILDLIPLDTKSGFAEDIFPKALAQGELLQSWTLEHGFIKDLASPERLAAVEKYLRNKKEIEEARVRRKPITAVFLDRDGVLNADTVHIHTPEQLVMLPDAAKAVKLLNDNGLKTIVVTNQPVLARGLCNERVLQEIHQKLRSELAKEHAVLDAIYYCPHHPETHHADGVEMLRRACDCRKPSPGMLLQAKDDHNLDLGACVMIGDSSSDIQAGRRAGVRTILLTSGAGKIKEGITPDHTYPTLYDAATAIVRGDIK